MGTSADLRRPCWQSDVRGSFARERNERVKARAMRIACRARYAGHACPCPEATRGRAALAGPESITGHTTGKQDEHADSRIQRAGADARISRSGCTRTAVLQGNHHAETAPWH